jgi:biotin carboxylase
MRTVMICHNAQLALVVLHALKANGIKPLLICDPAAAATLRASRLTGGIVLAGDLAAQPERVVEAINGHHRREPIDLVMASDVQSLCILDDIRGRLMAAVYPMPARPILDMLNDKWRFYQFIAKLGLDAPKTLFFPDRRSVDVRLVAREIGFPAVVKPVASWASIGFELVSSERDLVAVCADGSYRFESVVVQRFIPGRDAGLGLFAREGRLQAVSTFFCGPRTATEFADLPGFAAMCAKIAGETSYNGVANFDARVDATGRVWLLECNPRFFMRLGAARACGLDFLKLGLQEAGEPAFPLPAATGRYYSYGDLMSAAGIHRLLTGRWSVRLLMQGLREACADPGPLIVRHLSRSKL